MDYNILKPWESLDTWQKNYIETEGNCFLLCGRQVGKTTAMSIKFGTRAATRENRTILMIAFTERQAYNLFFKTLMFLETKYPNMIKRGINKPTKHEIQLRNGSRILCYAAGLSGEGIRTYTITDLVIDEAAPMSREVFISVSPMLSVTGGTMDISSTPRGKEGYFYECSKRDDFTKFYVSAEDCPRHKKEFLEQEKQAMSKLEYAQEYLAVFLDELKRVFSDEWISKVCVLKRRANIRKGADYFLGVDIARMGEDECSFEIVDRISRDRVEQVESIVKKKRLTTDTERDILDLEKLYSFRSIYLDAGSGTLGVSILDHLLEESQTKNKVVAINNRERVLDRDGDQKKKLLKEDLYNNLVRLGEKKEIKLLDDDELKLSLASVQYEYIIKANRASTLRIFGNYTHIAEGLIRAAWCVKDKRLNIYCRY